MYCYVFYQKGNQYVFDIGLLKNLAIKVFVQYEVYASRPVIAYTYFDCAPLSYSSGFMSSCCFEMSFDGLQ